MERVFDRFINSLTKSFPLNEEEIQFLKESIPIKRLSKGEYLLIEGEISKSFFYNISGFVRLFYLSDGEERTAFFYPEGKFIGAYDSFRNQKPSNFFFQAVEDSEVAIFNYEVAEKMLVVHPNFEKLARLVMEEELMNLQEMVSSLITLSPEKRYVQLMQKNPGIFNKVPQIQIASYIGVKPESLSRIKKRVHNHL
jgi:CRP-like cAMP-binding protein